MFLARMSAAGLCLLAAAVWLAGGSAADPVPTVFHVAPGGNDRGPGTREQPFATPGRARDAVRALKRRPGGLPGPVRVVLHGGTYFLSAPLVLTPEDSGTADRPVTFEAAPGERPVLSGGRPVTGWKEAPVNGRPLWAADVPDARAGTWSFHQLWVNGRRCTRARFPNQGFLRIAGQPGPAGPRDHGQDRFPFAPGDLRAWHNLRDVEVVALYLWVGARLPVEEVDEGRHLVTFAARSHRPLADGPEPARYWIENALELLDAPGEWYLDRPAGRLYYWPRPGETMTTAEAVAPALDHLVRLEGRPEAGRRVAHVTFRGLTFAHTEWWPARQDPADEQAAAPVPAAVRAEGARACALERCTLTHLGGYAVHLAGGCDHDRVAGCELSDLGAGGIKVGERAARAATDRQTHDNVVTDNHVHDGGHVFPQAVGVWIGQSFGNRIAHNHIHDFFYTGISCGWTWGYGSTLARDNVIEGNLVHDLGKGVLSDLGGVYTLGVQPGTVVRGNVFHDVAGYRYGGWGIYFDEGSTGIVAEDNLVYRTTHGGFHQHYGKDNIVRNNIFALGRDAQLQRTRAEPHRSFTFEHNVVYWQQGKLLEGRWDDDHFVMDHNLYWRADGREFHFGGQTWVQWRDRGLDRHSLIADPRFVGPGKGDFRLRDGSPVGKVGFHLPDLSGVGPRPAAR